MAAAADDAADMTLKIGVLALQGAFEEHQTMLHKLGVDTIQVRTPGELQGVDGLVLPGGESTAMGISAGDSGIFAAIKKIVLEGLPIMGTCAGMILLANEVDGQMQGGQALVGGLDVNVARNYFGSQVHSFELDVSTGLSEETEHPAVFIRAPAVISQGDNVEVLARVTKAGSTDSVGVAVRQDNIIATAFHPELTTDTTWHEMLLSIIRERKQSSPKQNS